MGATDIKLESGPRSYEAQVSQYIQGQKQKQELSNGNAGKIVQALVQPQRVTSVSASRSEFNKTVFSAGGNSAKGVGGKVDVTG